MVNKDRGVLYFCDDNMLHKSMLLKSIESISKFSDIEITVLKEGKKDSIIDLSLPNTNIVDITNPLAEFLSLNTKFINLNGFRNLPYLKKAFALWFIPPPYEKTLYLDNDTVSLRKFDLLFDQDKFICTHYLNKKYNIKDFGENSDKTKKLFKLNEFNRFNSGVVLYSFNNWVRINKFIRQYIYLISSAKHGDQSLLSLAIHLLDIPTIDIVNNTHLQLINRKENLYQSLLDSDRKKFKNIEYKPEVIFYSNLFRRAMKSAYFLHYVALKEYFLENLEEIVNH